MGERPFGQKIQISAFVGLQHMGYVQVLVAAGGRRFGRWRVRAPVEFRLVDQQLEPAVRHVEADPVPRLHPCQRTAEGGFRANVQNQNPKELIGAAAQAAQSPQWQ